MTKIDEQIKEYLGWCENVADMTEQTLVSKRYILYRFAQQTKIGSIEDFTNEVFNTWKNGMIDGTLTGKKHLPNTCNVRIRTVRAFVHWVKDCGELKVPAKIPFLTLVKCEDEKEYQFYSREQIVEVLKGASVMERAMIALMFESGLRLTEFQHIKLEDIDFEKNTIFVIGKGRKRGRVFFTDNTKRYLIKYINERKIEYGFLWASQRNGGMPYTRDALRSKMRAPFERVGIFGFTPHQLRHSFATDLIENGATIYEAQKLLRHNSSRTTETYIHNLQNTLGDVYLRLKRQGIYNKDSLYWDYPEKFNHHKVFYHKKA